MNFPIARKVASHEADINFIDSLSSSPERGSLDQ